MKKIPSNKTWKDLNFYKDTLILTQEQKDIIVGSCLGDLYIRQIGKYSRLVFEQKNKEYLFHLYEKFKHFTRTLPKERNQKRLETSDIKSTWYFSTISHSNIHDYRLLFYPINKKIIPLNLEELLTARSIAYWYMDDGAVSNNSCKLCTCGFTYEEHIFLQSLLKKKFNIHVTIQGLNSKTKQFFIYIKRESFLDFKNLIKPYILPSMLYKIHE